MKRLLLAALAAGGILQAQATKDYDFHLANGAEVLYQTYSQVDLDDPSQNFGTALASGNTISRTMTDRTNRRWLGFQLMIERLPGDPIRFRLSMGSLATPAAGMWNFFEQTAPPRIIQNGDRVLLDVLQEPGTGRKIFDTLQVGIGIGMHAMPTAKTIPQTPVAGAAVHLQNPEFLSGKTLLSKSGSGVSGIAAGVAVPGRGRFSFSTKPESGYRMEAIAEGNVLMFVTGADRYDIQCSSPVMDGAGAWYLWVKHDAGDGAASIPILELSGR